MNRPFYHEQVPVVVRLAQVVGITTAAAMSGANVGTTFFAVPALMKAPAPILAKQWEVIFKRGQAAMPPLSILSTAIFGYLAFRERSTGGPTFPLYVTAAVIAPSIMPFTLLTMMPTNRELLKRADSATSTVIDEAAAAVETDTAKGDGNKEESTHALIDRWASLNLVRGLISGAAAVLALWASLPAPVDVVAVESFEFISGANRL